VRDQVLNPYKTKSKVIILAIQIFIIFGSKWNHKIFWTEWQPTFLGHLEEEHNNSTLLSTFNGLCWEVAAVRLENNKKHTNKEPVRLKHTLPRVKAPAHTATAYVQRPMAFW
jgi:hypothetical protein